MAACDEQLMLDYATKFLGYGSLNSPLWLIGPEAGGGGTIQEIQERISVWEKRGRRETEDLQSYHAALSLAEKCDWSRNIQPTWGALIRVVLSMHDVDTIDRAVIVEFQKSKLGKLGGQNALLDLSQLSSPSNSGWIFGECGISWLKSREEYEARMLPVRAEILRKKLSECVTKPKLVLFYGLGHRRWWELISSRQFRQSQLANFWWTRDSETLFALIPHRNGIRGGGNGALTKFLSDVGSLIRGELH